MTSHDGKHYTCFLPVEETKTMKPMPPQNATNVIVESERRMTPKEPDELLKAVKDQCFYRVQWSSDESLTWLFCTLYSFLAILLTKPGAGIVFSGCPLRTGLLCWTGEMTDEYLRPFSAILTELLARGIS